MSPIQQFAAGLRDLLLDQHEQEIGIHRVASAIDFKPGLEARLLTVLVWRAEMNAQFAMKLSHILDELSEGPTEDDDGDAWKCSR